MVYWLMLSLTRKTITQRLFILATHAENHPSIVTVLIADRKMLSTEFSQQKKYVYNSFSKYLLNGRWCKVIQIILSMSNFHLVNQLHLVNKKK